MTGQLLLEVDHVEKTFGHGKRATLAVADMSLNFPSDQARVITVAGESGCGKSTLALMALGFVQPTAGAVRYRGVPVSQLDRAEFKQFRRKIQAVFQNPYETFNPFYRVSHPLELALRQIGVAPRSAEGRTLMETCLARVGLDADKVLGRHPHEMSGGQLQRISIARALISAPEVIVADEPVSMIDASLRTTVLRQLIELKQLHGISILYITHDLSTAMQISDELLIAHRGRIVERGDPWTVINHPQDAYTKQLVSAVPVPDLSERWSAGETPSH